MASIRVITGSANGPQESKQDIQSIGFVFITEDEDGNTQTYQPAVVENMMLEDDSEMSSVQDQCGRIENRSRGSKGFRYTVEGIITNTASVSQDNNSGNNLTPQRVKNLRNATTLRINSDLHSGPVVIRNFSISQNNELIGIDIGRGTEQAFPFQMQIQSPE